MSVITAIRTVLFILLTLCAAGRPANAQQDDARGTSYITPFPENDVYRVLVIGDSLADGLVEGLIETFERDTRLQISNRVRTFNGLARSDFDGEMRAFVDSISKEPVHVAVLMMGVYDRQPLRNDAGKRVPIGSEEWKAIYSRRADQVMRALKRRGAAIYWVSLPVLRRPEANEAAQITNDVVRDRAYLNGAKFVDVQAGTADETGNYNPYGPDLTGKMKLLRQPDGVHFTPAGNRKLAHFLERDLKRDLTQAKTDRNIPLAGSEAEQKRVSPVSSAAATAANSIGAPGAPASGSPNAKTPEKDGRAALTTSGAQPAPPAAQGPVEQKGEVARVTFKIPGADGKVEVLTADIVRPAIPASVVALVTRRESPDRPSQVGESLPETLPGGLMILNSVTPSGGGPGQRRRLAPTQMPYFRVLVKGERPTPKPGRLDDATWPRPEPEPHAEADAAAARAASPRPGTRNFPAKGVGPAPRG